MPLEGSRSTSNELDLDFDDRNVAGPSVALVMSGEAAVMAVTADPYIITNISPERQTFSKEDSK